MSQCNGKVIAIGEVKLVRVREGNGLLNNGLLKNRGNNIPSIGYLKPLEKKILVSSTYMLVMS